MLVCQYVRDLLLYIIESAGDSRNLVRSHVIVVDNNFQDASA